MEMIENDKEGIRLRLSAQRALWGHVSAALRAVSLDLEGHRIRFKAVFDTGASQEDVELISFAAAEVISDFPQPFTMEEQVEIVSSPANFEKLVKNGSFRSN